MELWKNFDLEQNILGAMVIREGEKNPGSAENIVGRGFY